MIGKQGVKKLFELPENPLDQEQKQALSAKTGKLISREPASVPKESGEGFSQSPDYIEDAVTGALTLLNTKEYQFYSFYERLRTQVVQHWYAKVESALESVGRNPASAELATINRTTKLIAYLDTQGALTELKLVGTSGVRELDYAAVESFRSAAPFPNPPKQLMLKEADASGRLAVVWTFVVQQEAGRPMRLQTRIRRR